MIGIAPPIAPPIALPLHPSFPYIFCPPQGHYWGVHPACISDFKNGNFCRRLARSRACNATRRSENYTLTATAMYATANSSNVASGSATSNSCLPDVYSQSMASSEMELLQLHELQQITQQSNLGHSMTQVLSTPLAGYVPMTVTYGDETSSIALTYG